MLCFHGRISLVKDLFIEMSFDLAFSQWLYNFYFLSDLAYLFSGRIFSGFVLFSIGFYFYKIKQLKTFIFICVITGLGDFIGNLLKDVFLQPRPCFSDIQYFPEVDKCGDDLTGMPSNHALNFFTFSTLVHLMLKNKIISFIFFFSSILVALSRVLLVKHLLSQVIIGSIIGIFLAFTAFKISRRWIKV